MTKQTYLSRIKKISEKWQSLLQLDGWTIKHVVVNDVKKFLYDEDDDAVAVNDSSWQYRDVKIYWSLKYANTRKITDLEECVLHEIIHVMVNEMRMWAVDPSKHSLEVAKLCLNHEERVVDQLVKAMLNVHRDGQD